MGFFNFLKSNGYTNQNAGIDQIDYGVELCSTGGLKTYGVNSYTLIKNGGGGQQQAPAVTTGSASNVTSTTATLGGSVNPENQATTGHFEYGTTTAYGSTTPDFNAGSGSGAVNETADLTGLQPSTTYHFRIDATNSTGTSQGADQTFTTPPAGGGTAVAFDAQSGAKKTGTSPLGWNLTVGSGTNRMVLVEATVGVPNPPGDVGCTQSVTMNGAPMSKLGVIHTNGQHSGFMDVWEGFSPPVGTNQFVMSVSGCASPTLTAVAESFTGAAQSLGTLVSRTGSGTSATGSVATADASDMVAAFAAAGNSLQAPGAPAAHSLLENQNANTGAGNSAGATAPATGGTVSVTWPISANDWWATGLVDLHHA